MNKLIHINCDGSCNVHGTQAGGWAIVIHEDGREVYKKEKGYYHKTTNQRMELTAMFHALFNAALYEIQGFSVKIYTDSAYIINCFTQKWYENWQKNNWKSVTGNSIKNKDLWEKILVQYSVLKKTDLIKIKRNTDKWSTMADQIAKSMMKLGQEQEIA